MENLSATVYECTLAVEAHMICDLLARGGVSARVDGEFLAGAGGDLPLGNTIKVRVDPARAAEAREIIAEWERLQPAEPVSAPPRSRARSPMWFAAGLMTGAAAIYLAFTSPVTVQGADFDGDGINDETYHYEGVTLRLTERDRKVDARWSNDFRGVTARYEADDDFDGRFERVSNYRDGKLETTTLDSNGDGRPDMVDHLVRDSIAVIEVYDEDGRRVVARQRYVGGWNVSTEFDQDGDGVFERVVEFDRFGMPR